MMKLFMMILALTGATTLVPTSLLYAAPNLVFDNFSTPTNGNNNVGGIHHDDGTLAASISSNTLTLRGSTNGY